jgi:paraquat-inducible protein B
MSQRPSYFKLGLFVLVSTALLLTAVSLLGANALFQQVIRAETSFVDSAEGISVGTPIKLRGVTLGKVSWIGFVEQKYALKETPAESATDGARVLVELAFRVIPGSPDETEGRLEEMIAQGMRVRKASAGLTGGTYLELFFPPPGDPPPPSLRWTPRSIYIPSQASVMQQIESAAERLARQLEAADISGLLRNVNTLITNASAKVDELDIKEIQTHVLALVDGLRESNDRVKALLSDPKLERIVADVASVTDSLRGAIGEQESDLARFIRELPEVTSRLKGAVSEIEHLLQDEQTKRMLANLSQASNALPGAAEDIRLLARRLESLVASQQQNLASIIIALRQTIENAEALTEDAKRNPSRLLLGEPPPRINPGASPAQR